MPDRRLPRVPAALLRVLLPLAEREEVLADLNDELRRRAAVYGPGAARRWVWAQAIRSMPALLARGWWRGTTGFEPRANRMRPGGPMFESWIIDARYACRRLVGRPTYAALAVLTLALGAGGAAAIFSVVRTVVLDPLPIVRQDEVGVLYFEWSWSEAEFLHLRGAFPGFSTMTALRPDDVTLEVPGTAMRLVNGMAVSSEFFDVLGTSPLLGRTFRQGDDAPGGELVVVLSHALWRELGSDPSVVGRRYAFGGLPRTVVGVMPPGFWFPSPAVRLWTPAQMSPQNRSGRYTLVGRVADGTSLDRMGDALHALTSTLGAAFQYPNPRWDKRVNPSVRSARDFLHGDVRPGLIATLAAMGIILLIACANVAALMLGQIDARATEIAVRSALGANRGRLLQQLLAECVVIGLLAGVTGAALAVAGFGVLTRALPLGALAETAALDWNVFAASMIASLAAAVLVSLVPGAALWRGKSMASTMATTRTAGISGRGGRLESGLVVVQVALAVVLAAGAGLLVRSVANLRAIDPGVSMERLAIVDLTLPTRLAAADRRVAIDQMIPALGSLPGVTSAGAAQKLPLRGSGDNWGIQVVGRPDMQEATTAFRMVTRDYLATMGLALKRGRWFTPSDRPGSEPVVVINEAAAAKFFPGEDPIGQMTRTFNQQGERIIGIVENAAEARLTDGPVPARYMLYDHVPSVPYQVSFVITVDDPGRLPVVLDLVRSLIVREGRPFAIQEMTTMGRVFERAMGPAAQVVTLLSLLAGLALVLGAVGVYGVTAHVVSRRSRDIAVRIALGQQPGRVVREIVGRGLALVALGGALGVIAAHASSRLLATLLYGVERTDPAAMAAAVVLLITIGGLAALIPARRASLVDPAVVLRQP